MAFVTPSWMAEGAGSQNIPCGSEAGGLEGVDAAVDPTTNGNSNSKGSAQSLCAFGTWSSRVWLPLFPCTSVHGNHHLQVLPMSAGSGLAGWKKWEFFWQKTLNVSKCSVGIAQADVGSVSSCQQFWTWFPIANSTKSCQGVSIFPLDVLAGMGIDSRVDWCRRFHQNLTCLLFPKQELALKSLGNEGLFLFSSLDTNKDLYLSPEEFKPIAEKLTGRFLSAFQSPPCTEPNTTSSTA